MRHAQHEARHASVPTRLCCSRLTFRSVLTKEGRVFGPAFLVHSYRPTTLTVMSTRPSSHFPQASQDIGFAVALRRLPWQSLAALVEHEPDDAGILECYPRKPIGILGLQSEKTAAVLDSTRGGTGASFGYGLVPMPVLFLIFYCFLVLPFFRFCSLFLRLPFIFPVFSPVCLVAS